MKKFLAFLLFLLFLILLWFSWKWYQQTVVCCDEPVKVETTETANPEPEKYGPLVFNWDSDKAITNDLWPDQKSNIIAGMREGSILQIIGSYFKDEVNTSSFENLGLARANAVKQLLLDKIPEDKIELSAKVANALDDAKTKPFGGTELSWAVRNENIQEVNNKTLIYFPYNSTEKVDNSNINNYIKSVAESLKGNEKTVSLTGHTDNIGNPTYNNKLALQRAQTIKDLLVTLGVNASRISVASEGQESPIASNDTNEGRQKNRRVELEIK